MKALLDAAVLARASLSGARGRSAALVFGIAVALFLPWLSGRLGATVEASLLSRALSTPIVVGREGDTHDLVMAAVYFRGDVVAPLTEADVLALDGRTGTRAIPVHLGHTAGGVRVVGTDLAYLDQRGLTVDGRAPAVLGEVVVGSAVAARRGIGVGDQLRSDVRNPYDVSGAFPLLLQVVGVLHPAGSVDDEVILADLKTAWVMDGLLHGHEDGEAGDVLAVSSDHVALAPSLFFHTEIDAENLARFHLHGGPQDRPVSAALIFPEDARAHDTLLGAVELQDRVQAVRPEVVVRRLLGMLGRLQDWLTAAVALVWLSTAGMVATVVALTLRIRRDELVLMRRLGASAGRVAMVVGVELSMIAALGFGVAVVAAEAMVWWIRWQLGLG